MLHCDLLDLPKLFLRASLQNTCTCVAAVYGEAVNLGDGDGMQVPCKLIFSGEEKFIAILEWNSWPKIKFTSKTNGTIVWHFDGAEIKTSCGRNMKATCMQI